ncbi:trypsin-like serine peptidase [Rhodococcus sp. NPDC127528]|uniref:trypsin-like serine peptidase n=1 Tax=unclassified Rhodococcus (in: high G+C Gram-positive bacteria) TaxID=192944 RepID=UPI0036355F23
MPKLRTLVASGLAASSLVVTFGVAVSNAAPDMGLPQDNVSKGVVSSGAAQIYIPADVATKMSARGVPASKQHNAEYAEMALDEYWTPERMENAIPMEMEAPGDAIAIPRESTPKPLEANQPNGEAPEVSLSDPVGPTDPLPDTTEPAQGAAGKAANQTESGVTSGLTTAAVTPTTTYSPANGKIFYRKASDGKDYSCSGSAVNSPSRNLVATAAHCVHGGPGGTWHENWRFVPMYQFGVHPYGSFQAKEFFALPGWGQNGVSWAGYDEDQAFVVTNNQSNGKSVVDRVGAHGLRWSGSTSFPTNIFGYPLSQLLGLNLFSCWGTTTSFMVANTTGYYDFPRIDGCNFGPGASGGPWLEDYDPSNGRGWIRSVTSFVPSDNSYIGGPNFDSRTINLWTAANAAGL